MPPGFIEGNPVHTSLHNDVTHHGLAGNGYSGPWLSPAGLHFTCSGETPRKQYDERIFLMRWRQYKSHWPENDQGSDISQDPLYSTPCHCSIPPLPPLNIPLESTSHWALSSKAFPLEEGKLFTGLFLLRFSYGLIFICLNDLIFLGTQV